MMKINKTLIILSLLLVFYSLGAVSATEDVDVNDIDNNYVATVESSVMNEEISTVSEGQINKSSEIYDDIKSATGIYNITTDYQIDKTWEISNANVIIEGNNHTIYGNGNQAFRITGNDVIIKNLNFVNCSANTGGAIYFYNDGSGNVSGCSFVNCNGNDGGAINRKMGGSAINVSGCSFVNCNGEDGGAIYLGNGGSVTSCSFVNCSSNSKIYGHGGAIYSYGGSVTSCSFVNCSANDKGGAIYFEGIGSVNYCIFDNNDASVGKAIFGSYDINYDFNFFSFKNDRDFPKHFIEKNKNSIIPNNWVVLDVVRSGDDYVVKFVTDEGNDLIGSMPDYVACLTINGVSKEILIKNNTFNDTFVPGNYLLTSLNSGKVLANRTYRTHIDIIPTALSTTYGSGKYFIVKVLDKNKKPVSGVKLTLKIYTGSKVNKTVTVTTDKNGIAKYSASKLSIGTHKVTVTVSNHNYIASVKSSSIKVAKAPTKLVNATKLVVKNHKNFYVKLTTKSGKVLANKVIKMKSSVSGKIYKMKTNSKGIAKIDLWVKNKPLGKYYKYTFKYAGSKYYNSCTKTFKIKIIK